MSTPFHLFSDAVCPSVCLKLLQEKILADLLSFENIFLFSRTSLEASLLRKQPVSAFHTLKSFWPL